MSEATLVTIDAEAEAKAHEAETMLATYQNYAVTTANDYTSAADELKRIKAKAKELDELRKSMTKPMDEAKKRIMDFFRKPTEMLEQAENIIKRSMLAYQQEQERIRQIEEARLREEQRKEAERLARLQREAEERARIAAEEGNAAKAAADLAKAEAFQERQALVEAAPVVVAPMTPTVAGISTRKSWKFRIVDEAAVPREYLTINETLLGNVARATKGTLKVPGVEFYAEDVLAAGR